MRLHEYVTGIIVHICKKIKPFLENGINWGVDRQIVGSCSCARLGPGRKNILRCIHEMILEQTQTDIGGSVYEGYCVRKRR